MIKAIIKESIDTKARLIENDQFVANVASCIEIMLESLKNGGKLLFCGNGGSAADAQHIAAELSGRFLKDRRALPAEALHVNTSFMTAVANDYGYDEVFARGVEAFGSPGDILVCISTSGNSPSITNAAKKAQKIGMKVVGMTGRNGGQLSQLCDLELRIPSDSTARIQECHMLIGHIICRQIEEIMFP